MRSEAVKLATRGFSVVKLAPGTKRPLADGWQQSAVSDPFAAYEAWTGPDGQELNCNVGIWCRDLVALDFDVAKGGLEAHAALAAEIGGFPETFTVRTARGGLHLYFRAPTGIIVGNSRGALPEGIDVRGSGGQCVGPGSVFIDPKTKAAGIYAIELDAPIAPLPDAILAKLRARPEDAAAPAAAIGERDTPSALASAQAYVAAFEETPEGGGSHGGRDNAAFVVASRMYDLGLSRVACRQMLGEWNDAKCSPPLTDDALDRIASSAETSRQEPIGRDNPLLGFAAIEPVPLVLHPLIARIKPYRMVAEDLPRMPCRPWVAARRLMRGSITSLVAPGSIGKSLLTLQWAVALAIGNGGFTDLDVLEQCNVLVINNEDPQDELDRRLVAVIEHFSLGHDSIRDKVHTLSGVGNPFMALVREGKHSRLSETESVKLIIDFCREYSIGVIIIDPLVNTHEASESDNSEMSKVMDVFKRMAAETNTALLIVHHTRKPPSADSDGYAGNADSGRGASAVVNAVRTGLTLFNMSPKDSDRYGVPPQHRHRYVRLDDAKTNLFMASPDAEWFQRKTVVIPNGEETGVLVPVSLRDKKADESTLIVDVVARYVTDVPVAVSALAKTVIAAEAMFAERKPSTFVRQIIEAVQSVDSAFTGKKLEFVPVGQTGGTLKASDINAGFTGPI